MTQCDRARAYANEVRIARADLRRRLYAGELHVVDVIIAPPEHCGGMRLFELLDRAPSPHITGRPVSLSPGKHRRAKRWLRPLNLRAALANVNLFSEIDD